jgi:MFS family permease
MPSTSSLVAAILLSFASLSSLKHDIIVSALVTVSPPTRQRFYNFIDISLRQRRITYLGGKRETQTEEDIVSYARKRSTTIELDDEAQNSDMVAIPPEILRPFALLLLSQFILFVGVGAVIPTIPLYGQSIGLSSTSNGIVIGAPALALLLANRPAGQYADGLGRKKAMMGGMALIALSDLGTAYSSDLPSLVTARLGLGLGRGYAEAGERGMLADLANCAPGLRGRALAIQQACVALGIAIGAPLGGVVVQEYGPRSAFLCVSVAAIAALAIYAILPDTRGSNAIDDTGIDDESGGADWKQLLMTSSTWRSLAAAQSGASFGFACKISIVPILADQYLGGPAGAGLLLSAAGLAGLVGAPLGGLLADRSGPRFAAATAGILGGLSLALIPIAFSQTKLMDSWTLMDNTIFAGLGNPEAAVSFVLLVLLWSVGASAQSPALTALAQEKAPEGNEASALGLPRFVGDGTYIVAPFIMGYFCDLVEDVPGIGCTIAGSAIILGSLTLLSVDPLEDADNVDLINRPEQL